MEDNVRMTRLSAWHWVKFR